MTSTKKALHVFLTLDPPYRLKKILVKSNSTQLCCKLTRNNGISMGLVFSVFVCCFALHHQNNKNEPVNLRNSKKVLVLESAETFKIV